MEKIIAKIKSLKLKTWKNIGLAAVLTLATGAGAMRTFGHGKSFNPEIVLLKAAADSGSEFKDKAAGLPELQSEEAGMNASKNLSSAEVESIANDKTSGEKNMVADPQNTEQGDSVLGKIMDADAVPNPFYDSEFKVINSWRDNLHGTIITVFAGVKPSKPNKGALYVFRGNKGRVRMLSIGPARIVGVNNGVLTLQSGSKTITVNVTK